MLVPILLWWYIGSSNLSHPSQYSYLRYVIGRYLGSSSVPDGNHWQMASLEVSDRWIVLLQTLLHCLLLLAHTLWVIGPISANNFSSWIRGIYWWDLCSEVNIWVPYWTGFHFEIVFPSHLSSLDPWLEPVSLVVAIGVLSVLMLPFYLSLLYESSFVFVRLCTSSSWDFWLVYALVVFAMFAIVAISSIFIWDSTGDVRANLSVWQDGLLPSL